MKFKLSSGYLDLLKDRSIRSIFEIHPATNSDRWRSLSAQADAFAEAKASPTRWQSLRFALTERESFLIFILLTGAK